MGLSVDSVRELTEHHTIQNGNKKHASCTSVFNYPKTNQCFDNLQNFSALEVEVIANDLITEKNKSVVTKFFDKIFTFCKDAKTDIKFDKAKQILTSVEQKLNKQGITLSGLNEDEQKKYLKALLSLSSGLVSDYAFITTITAINKERLSHIIKENSEGLKKYFSFLRKNFKEVADESAKLNIAAVSVSTEHLPKDATNDLLLLYSSTIPERRKEVIEEALKRLPDNISQKEILELSMSSENMSVMEINFAKDYIMASDLPENIKQEKLKMLEYFSKPDELRKITTLISQIVCKYKNIKFDVIIHKIKKEDKVIDNIKDDKNKLSKKLDDLSLKKEKLETDIYYQKIKLKRMKENQHKHPLNNNKVTSSTSKQFEEEKSKMKKMMDDFSEVISDIKVIEKNLDSRNFQVDMHLNFQSNMINSSGLV